MWYKESGGWEGYIKIPLFTFKPGDDHHQSVALHALPVAKSSPVLIFAILDHPVLSRAPTPPSHPPPQVFFHASWRVTDLLCHFVILFCAAMTFVSVKNHSVFWLRVHSSSFLSPSFLLLWGHYLQAQSHGHHIIHHLKLVEESRVERGSARRSSLKGRESGLSSIRWRLELFQGRATFGETSERWVGAHIWCVFSWAQRYHLELNRTNSWGAKKSPPPPPPPHTHPGSFSICFILLTLLHICFVLSLGELSACIYWPHPLCELCLLSEVRLLWVSFQWG